MITSPPAVKEEQFPRIPEDLLKKLDELFPERCAELKDDPKTIRHKAGQRSVVRFLKDRFEQQNANILSAKNT